jgi:HEAT repeat protein
MRKAMHEDPMPQVKTQAATALALMNDTDSFSALIDLLIHSPNDSIKTFASLSLAFMGDIRIVEDLNERLAGENLDELTRAHCLKLCARLLSGRTAPYLEPLAAGSNFASEFPMVGYLLDFGL